MTPRSCISSATIVRPVITISLVKLIPIFLVSLKLPPPPGIRFNKISGRPIFVPAAATIISQASAISKPPPKA